MLFFESFRHPVAFRDVKHNAVYSFEFPIFRKDGRLMVADPDGPPVFGDYPVLLDDAVLTVGQR